MPTKSKSKTKIMKPVDTSKPNGNNQFKPIEKTKQILKKGDIFEITSNKNIKR